MSGNNRVEPVVANGSPNTAAGAKTDNAQCANAQVGAGNSLTQLGISQAALGVQTATAATSIEPELGKAISQKVGALAKVEQLNLGAGLTVSAAISSATGSCSGLTPTLTATSQVAGINTLNLDPLITGLGNLLSVAPNLINIKTNEQIRTPTSLTVRALHVTVLSPTNGPPLLDLIVAESKVGFNGPVCDPNAQIPGAKPCPEGATYDQDRNLCIIPGSSGSKFGEIIIGLPFQGPSGGSVLPLDLAQKKYGKKRCLVGAGPNYAIIGTNGRDRITGTNKPDRILGLGAADSISGGRGNDCLDGGTGGDSLSGSIGNDKLLGGSGNDHLNGASGTDTLSGESGNDSINAGFGRDKVSGGSGRDFINVATAGPPATVDCGAGRDKVRVNFNERNRTRGCEVKYVFHDTFRR